MDTPPNAPLTPDELNELEERKVVIAALQQHLSEVDAAMTEFNAESEKTAAEVEQQMSELDQQLDAVEKEMLSQAEGDAMAQAQDVLKNA